MGTLAAIPLALGRAVDDGLRAGSSTGLVAWIGVLFVLGLATALTWAMRHFVAGGLHVRSRLWLEDELAQRALDRRGGLAKVYSSGDLVSIAGVDIKQVARLIDVICRGTGAVVTLSVVLGSMLAADRSLAVAVALTVAPLLLGLVLLARLLAVRATVQQEALARASSIAGDAITGLRVLKGISAEASIRDHYALESETVMRTALRSARFEAATASLNLAMQSAVVALVAWLGGRFVLEGALSVGELVTFSGWSIFLMVPLLTFGEVGVKWASGTASATRLVAVLTTPYECDDTERPKTDVKIAAGQQPCIATRELCSGDGTGGLVNVSITIPSGALIGIVCNPATTATWIDLLTRRSRPTAGAIELEGTPIGELSLSDLRERVVVAEHDAVLFAGSLRTNLAVARSSATDDEMRAALEVAAADDIVESLAGDLGGPVSEKGRSLSGGQRQRVALARALLVNPALLVLIEPTSAVDSFTESEILDRLPSYRRGKATMVFTTNPAVLSRVDEVVFIDDAAVCATGAHHLLLSRPRYCNALGLRSAIYRHGAQ